MAPSECVRDAEFIVDKVLDTHPDATYKLGKSGFEHARAAFLAAAGECRSTQEFWQAAQRFMARVGDAHTCMFPAGKDQGEAPVELDWVDGNVVVTRVMDESLGVERGDVVLFVDDREAGRALDDVLELTPHNFHDNGVRNAAARLLVFEPDREEVDVTLGKCSGGVAQCTLPLYAPSEPRLRNWKAACGRERATNVITWELWEEPDVGYLRYAQCVDRTIPYFVDRSIDLGLHPEQLPVMAGVCRELLEAMDHARATRLVVDLRGNTGGASFLGHTLLNYLSRDPLTSWGSAAKVSHSAKEFLQKNRGMYPEYYQKEVDRFLAAEVGTSIARDSTVLEFPYDGRETPGDHPLFEGELIVLTDSLTFSSGEWLAAELRDNGLGIFVGEPTGGGGNSPGDTLYFKTPNQELGFSVSHKLFTRPDSSRALPAVVPDYYLRQKLADYRCGVDTVLEWVRHLEPGRLRPEGGEDDG